MYKIERKFSLPIGHRLSKHKGKCSSFHGHNFTILVGVKSKTLDDNDMVIDFSDLDDLVMKHINVFDHCTILNKSDYALASKLKETGGTVLIFDSDPTAEKLAENIYKSIQYSLQKEKPNVLIDYVIVYENEKSRATYSED